jgi:integrase
VLACRNPSSHPLVITALHTGFRKSELLSLRWEHVDFRHRLITVEADYAKNHETRSIPMTATVTESSRALQGAADRSTSVFLTYNGTPYRHIAKVFGAACQQAGVSDVTFHDLRHTFAAHGGRRRLAHREGADGTQAD